MKWILVAALMMTATFNGTPAEAKSQSRGPASAEQRATVTDVVKKLREDDEGIVVLFVKTPGSHYLRRDVAAFDDYRKKLEASLSGKKPVSVTIESSQLNILEVK
ncbi:hypothetical protein QJS83_01205 [Bdellovibrio sp. 22V]|uniref:hypothetical protein n=1 Tax=Bdellovibrio TaxID=958 RepID=UPI002542F662|nr:hypothetical protein [Bdellovibrio sp. 22V]WII72485.1 hypothetical protein QJS83_01205 [Bdellovibrio sp. 22V]